MAMMGQREYSRHRKCALRAVQKAIEAGRIKTVLVGTRQMIDSDQADRDWQAHTDPAKQSMLKSAGPSPAAAPAGGDPAAAAVGDEKAAADEETSTAYREARASREELRLQREQYEFEQLRGQLIDVDEARRLAFTAFRSLRDNLLNIPARLKDQMAAETDALRIEQLLDAELTEALTKFDPGQVVTEVEDEDDEDA